MIFVEPGFISVCGGKNRHNQVLCTSPWSSVALVCLQLIYINHRQIHFFPGSATQLKRSLQVFNLHRLNLVCQFKVEDL